MSTPPEDELPGVSERAVAWYRRRTPRGRLPLALALALTLAGAVVSAVGLVRIDAENPHLRHSPSHLVGVDATPTAEAGAQLMASDRESRRATGPDGASANRGDAGASSSVRLWRHPVPSRERIDRGGHELRSTWARVGDVPKGARWVWFAVGFGLLLSGAVGAIALLRRELVREEYLLLHTEGFVLLCDGKAVEVAWDRVEAVSYEAAERAVEVHVRGYEKGLFLRDRFVGVEGPALARRMEEIRRKASFGLLPEQRDRQRGTAGDQNT